MVSRSRRYALPVYLRLVFHHLVGTLLPASPMIPKELMSEYGGRVNFALLEVTNDETTCPGATKAKALGLGAFRDEQLE
jgi:hypothetical protein